MSAYETPCCVRCGSPLDGVAYPAALQPICSVCYVKGFTKDGTGMKDSGARGKPLEPQENAVNWVVHCVVCNKLMDATSWSGRSSLQPICETCTAKEPSQSSLRRLVASVEGLLSSGEKLLAEHDALKKRVAELEDANDFDFDCDCDLGEYATHSWECVHVHLRGKP